MVQGELNYLYPLVFAHFQGCHPHYDNDAINPCQIHTLLPQHFYFIDSVKPFPYNFCAESSGCQSSPQINPDVIRYFYHCTCL
jgi:hypothetical protein